MEIKDNLCINAGTTKYCTTVYCLYSWDIQLDFIVNAVFTIMGCMEDDVWELQNRSVTTVYINLK